jgi:hypothetical protein
VTQHIGVTLNIAFTGLTANSNETPAQQQQQLAAANALIGQMTVTLTASGGATSTLMSPVSGAAGAALVTNAGQTYPVFDYTFDTVRNWNETSNKDYHVTVTYPSGTTPDGVIQSAELNVYGDSTVASSSTAHIYTNEFGALSSDANNAARGTLSDYSGNVTLNAAAVSIGSVFDLNAGSTDTRSSAFPLGI